MLDKPRRDWTLEEAQGRLEEVMDAAMAGTPQVVSREDGAAVVVLLQAEYDRLARPRTFKEHLLSFPHGGDDDLDFEADRRSFRMRDVEF